MKKLAPFALLSLELETIVRCAPVTLTTAREAAKTEAQKRKSAVLLLWAGWDRGLEYIEINGRFGKLYNHNGQMGCVDQWTARDTKTLVGLYHSVQAGMEDDPTLPWCTFCEVHHTLVAHATLAEARRTRSPMDFCDGCRYGEDLDV